jgi:hypothetical protein
MFWTAVLMIVPTFIFTQVTDYLYPGKLRRIAMKTSWKAMEICSKIEIYASKLYNNYIPAFIKYKPQSRIKFIYDGVATANYTFNEFLTQKNKIKMNYDFILYEIPITKKDNYTKYDKYVLRYENINDVIHSEYNSLKCFELNVIQITINDSLEVPIEFGRNQYMMNGNVLFDRKFLKWYLNIYSTIILGEKDKYVVTFIDHNMNYITLPDYCYILIKKNSYDIVNEVSVNNDEPPTNEENIIEV